MLPFEGHSIRQQQGVLLDRVKELQGVSLAGTEPDGTLVVSAVHEAFNQWVPSFK